MAKMKKKATLRHFFCTYLDKCGQLGGWLFILYGVQIGNEKIIKIIPILGNDSNYNQKNFKKNQLNSSSVFNSSNLNAY